ncbi:VRR-NUC domain-containing protein [Zooshikella marina]|uniref:VRR-NUC domain-containing protein n=1 Tax=Zooshikella ganghwensis TaxID=202772 RepID=UPI001BAFEE19|nr:VRR-NUC domain-containing protein [Zooshikella ganghwensis]MBU2708948.1 VRR-NUC domain-containing protein [Zooshikella ganghwensis]
MSIRPKKYIDHLTPAYIAKRQDLEGQEQKALFIWMYARYRALYDCAFHVPNGGHRHVAVAKKLKGEGVKAGVPDILILQPRGGYHGLAIEFKATPPKSAPVSDSQLEWINRLTENGYMAVVCKGFAAAKETIIQYANLNHGS